MGEIQIWRNSPQSFDVANNTIKYPSYIGNPPRVRTILIDSNFRHGTCLPLDVLSHLNVSDQILGTSWFICGRSSHHCFLQASWRCVVVADPWTDDGSGYMKLIMNSHKIIFSCLICRPIQPWFHTENEYSCTPIFRPSKWHNNSGWLLKLDKTLMSTSIFVSRTDFSSSSSSVIRIQSVDTFVVVPVEKPVISRHRARVRPVGPVPKDVSSVVEPGRAGVVVVIAANDGRPREYLAQFPEYIRTWRTRDGY